MATTESASVRTGGAATRENRSRPPILDLGLLLRAAVRSLPLAVAAGVVVGLIAGFALSTVRPTYATTTTVTVGTPSRAEKDAATMEALGAAMSEFVTDEQVRRFVEERTGEEVSLRGLSPTLEVSTTKIPGVIEVITRSKTGPLAATAMGRATVDAMNLRSNEVRDEFLEQVDTGTQKQIDDLNAQIAARRRIDPTADTSDLLALIYDARMRADSLRVGYTAASIISQDDAEGEPTWPKPAAGGMLAGLVVTLLAAVTLAALRVRRSRSTDDLWARSMGHRHDAVVDVDTAAPDGLPARTEAAVAGVLSRGGTVVLLGDVSPIETPEDDQGTEGRLHVAALDEPWWRTIQVSGVDLGVVVVDDGARSPRAAEAGLESFTEVAVPSRVVVRRKARTE